MINNRKSLYSHENCFCTMRRSKQEIMDKAKLDEILAGSEICRLSMLDGQLPYIIPVNYGYREGKIYIHSAPKGKKIELLLKNEQVVGYATVEILSDESSKQEGLEVIMAQHGAPELVDFDPGNMKRMVIIKLTIVSVTGKQSSNWDHTF